MELSCQQQLQLHKSQYFWNSGKFLAQMGRVDECLAMENNSSYHMVNFINNNTNKPALLYYGMCLPSTCLKQQIESFIKLQLKDKSEIIHSILGFPLEFGNLDQNPQNYTYEVTAWTYFTIFLLLLFFCLALISSIRKSNKINQKASLSLKIINCFNVRQSLKIFTYQSAPLNIFNGIRTLNMFWIIVSHHFLIRFRYNANISGTRDQAQSPTALFIVGGFLSVDVFFFISGFLLAHSLHQKKYQKLLKLIFYRVLRFWPSLIMAILIYYSVYIHLGDGPLWKENMTLGQIPNCSKSWESLLFIDNLIDNGQNICLPWSWYLQNDIQILIFTLFFYYIYTKNQKAGYLCFLGGTLASLYINTIAIIERQTYILTHVKYYAKWNEYFINIYIKPWNRCTPYILGFVLGLIYMDYLSQKKNIKKGGTDKMENQSLMHKMEILMKKKRWMVGLTQILGVLLMLGTICLPIDLVWGNIWPIQIHGIYLSFNKLTFTFGVYLVVLPSLLEIPNLSFFLLNTKLMSYLSKISFWTYLLHLLIVQKVTYEQKVDFYYKPSTILPISLSIIVISLFFAFIGTILIEVPFANLMKINYSTQAKEKKEEKTIHIKQNSINSTCDKGEITTIKSQKKD